MKRIFAALCALLLVPTMASAELISITELVQETPEAWIEEIDVNGKTISIDAPIYVPEVETLPVIRVMREKTVENTEALFKKEGTKYNEMDCYNRSRHKKRPSSCSFDFLNSTTGGCFVSLSIFF